MPSRRTRSRDRRKSSVFTSVTGTPPSRRVSNIHKSRRQHADSVITHSDDENQKTHNSTPPDSRNSSVHAADADLEFLLTQFIKERRRSKVGRSRKRLGSSDGTGSGESEDESILHMYEEDGDEDPGGSSEEEEIFENIKLQKEIIENVRHQPWTMGKKRQMLGLAKSYVEKHEGQLSRSHGYQEKGAQVLRRLKRELGNLQTLFIPWEMRIKQIESHFGSVVASYFVFLRWLVWINIWLTLIPVCFVILPEAMVGADHGTPHRKLPPEHKIEEMANLKTIWDAEGIVKYSLMFYGYYGNEETIGQGYRLPLAYFLTGMVSLAFSFIVILRRMAANSRMNRTSSKDEQFTFSWKLFTSWDYMIGNSETANNKVAAINIAFRESILEEEEKVKEGNKYLTYFLRFLANLFVVIMLSSSTYAIQILVDRSRDIERRKVSENYEASFWEENEVTVVMTLISTLFPNVVELLSLMEKHHPRTALRWQLARIFVMNLINLYTLFIALYEKAGDMIARSSPGLCNEANTTMTTSVNTLNSTLTVVATQSTTPCSVTVSTTMEKQCWETMIGQELVKLTLLDLVFVVGQVIVIDFIRGLCVKYLNVLCCWDLESKFPEYPEFKTAENILHLINNQGMIWLGTFFSPGLPPLNMIKMLVLLYLRCWACLSCNVPQDRIFRASRSNNFYYGLLLIMLFLCTLPVIFAIMIMKPSDGCGPFSDFDSMSKVLITTMREYLSKTAMTVLDYIASPAVIIPIFMLLALGIYYLLSSNRSKGEVNKDLKMQLEYERTDGRKKVYAMAGAKKDLDDVGGDLELTTSLGKKISTGKDQDKPSMATAVSSMMAASKMAKLLAHEQNPPIRKPPVAVVQGKQTLPGKHKHARRSHLTDVEAHARRDVERNSESVESDTDIALVGSMWRRAIASTKREDTRRGERIEEKPKTRKENEKRDRRSKEETAEERAAGFIQASFRRKKAAAKRENVSETEKESDVRHGKTSTSNRHEDEKRDKKKSRFLKVDDSSDSDSDLDEEAGLEDVSSATDAEVKDRRKKKSAEGVRNERARADEVSNELPAHLIPQIYVTDHSDDKPVEEKAKDNGGNETGVNNTDAHKHTEKLENTKRKGNGDNSPDFAHASHTQVKTSGEQEKTGDERVVINIHESREKTLPQRSLVQDIVKKMGKVPPIIRQKPIRENVDSTKSPKPQVNVTGVSSSDIGGTTPPLAAHVKGPIQTVSSENIQADSRAPEEPEPDYDDVIIDMPVGEDTKRENGIAAKQISLWGKLFRK